MTRQRSRFILVSYYALVKGGLGQPSPFEPDPIFESVDLNATYTAMKSVFARMDLTPKEMAVLIGGGHSSGQNSLEGGTYHGNWVAPMTLMGNAYFQLLSGHKNWCAVRSSDNGNAHFVAKGVAQYIAETEYSPLAKYEGAIPCVETAAGRAIYDNLPTVPAEDLIHQPGTWHKPSGAAAFLPVDFALGYSMETYQFVVMWALNPTLFFQDFQDAWAKLTESGQGLRCPNVNGLGDLDYSSECAARFGEEASYRETWIQIRRDIKTWFDALPPRCNSIRPGGSTTDPRGSVCPSSVLRLGFHLSATYDREATDGIAGGSSGSNFLEPCKMYDGCAGCLLDTQLGLQKIQQRYKDQHVSLADVSIFASGMAAAYLAELKLNHMLFHPGRVDPDPATLRDVSTCEKLGARLPSPAYQWQAASRKENGDSLAGMLKGDLQLPPKGAVLIV